MLLSHRRRRGPYALVGTARRDFLRRVIALVVVIFVIYWVGGKILAFFGVGNPRERSAVTVVIDKGTSAEVSLNGADWQHAESGMKMYWDDAIRTGSDARVSLAFFDGTRMRLDTSTELHITDSAKGKKESAIALTLPRGALWVDVPATVSLSGSIVRTVATPTFTYTLPASARGLITPQSLFVYSAADQGIMVAARRHTSIYIGEGQKWITGSGALKDDLYTYRSPLDAISSRNPFILESLNLFAQQSSASSSLAALPAGEFLTLTSPVTGASMAGGTLTIAGKVTKDVSRVELNGADVPINEADLSFTQTMAPPDGTDDILVTVRAFDVSNTLLAEVKRSVKRLPVVFNPPNIESPAKNGETYRTNKDEFVLRGSAPAGATGIMVNDYLLQLFDPAKGTWSYLAAIRLSNLKAGENRFDVYALYPGPNGTQRKSDPATVIIRVEDGPEGVLSTSNSSNASSVSSGKPVLNNDPLKPGSLAVIAPLAGTSASVSGTGTLIEGTTGKDTDTLWVNDYRLQLYRPGKTTWNYIASPDLKNLVPGANTFTIITRNAKGEVLDKLVYTIQYTK